MRKRIAKKEEPKISMVKQWLPEVSEADFFRKNLNYILFVFALVFLYILNQHWASVNYRLIEEQEQSLDRLEWEYQAYKTEWLEKSRVENIKEAVSVIGLKQLDEKAYKLLDDQ